MSWRLKEKLVLDIPLNNNAKDLSGNLYHGTWIGTEDYDENPFGISAGKLDGSNTYIQLLSAILNYLNGNIDFSIELWFISNTADGMMFGARDANDDGLRIQFSSSNVAFSINTIDSISGALPLKTEHHVIAIRDADGLQSLYVNGRYKDSDDTSGQTLAISSAPRIGIRAYDLNTDFNGLIWGIKLYNCALTYDEAIKRWERSHR